MKQTAILIASSMLLGALGMPACGSSDNSTQQPTAGSAGDSGVIKTDAGTDGPGSGGKAGSSGSSGSGGSAAQAGSAGNAGGGAGQAGSGGMAGGSGAAGGAGTAGQAGGGPQEGVVGGWYYGLTGRSVAVQGEMLYAGSGNTILVIDTTDKASPVLRSSVEQAISVQGGGPQTGRHLVFANNHVAAKHNGGLVLTDVTDPDHAKILSTFHPSSGASVQALDAQNTFVYLATTAGMLIVDASVPAAPAERGTYKDGSGVGGVVVSGTWAFLSYANSGDKVEFVDLTDPDHPEAVGDGYTPTGAVYDLAVDGDRLYAAGYGFVDLVNIADKQHPAKLNTFQWNNSAYASIEAREKHFFVGAHDTALFVVDAADPTDLSNVATYKYNGGYPGRPALSGSHLFLPLHYRGVEAIDISQPLSPSHVASYHSLEPNHIPIYGRVFTVDAEDSSNTLVALDDKGLLVFDTSDFEHPTLQSYTDLDGRASQVLLRGNTVYAAASWTGFLVVDITNRKTPEIKCHFNPAYYVVGVAVQGTEAFLLCTDDKIRVYDVSNPTPSCGNEKVLGEVTMTGTDLDNRFASLTVANDYVYVAGYKGGLFVYHRDAPGTLTLVHQSNVLPSPQGISVDGNLAVVTDSATGKFVLLDVSNPASPQTVSTQPLKAVGSPSLVGSSLLLSGAPAAYHSAIYLFDLTTPSAPTTKATLEPDFGLESLMLASNNVYVGAYADGLRTMSVATLQKLGGL